MVLSSDPRHDVGRHINLDGLQWSFKESCHEDPSDAVFSLTATNLSSLALPARILEKTVRIIRRRINICLKSPYKRHLRTWHMIDVDGQKNDTDIHGSLRYAEPEEDTIESLELLVDWRSMYTTFFAEEKLRRDLSIEATALTADINKSAFIRGYHYIERMSQLMSLREWLDMELRVVARIQRGHRLIAQHDGSESLDIPTVYACMREVYEFPGWSRVAERKESQLDSKPSPDDLPYCLGRSRNV